MKVKYESFKIGSKVYGISHYNKDGKPTIHCAILPAIVKSVYIEYNKKTNKIQIDYWLSCPDGVEWGAEIPEEYVFDSFTSATKYMKKIWDAKANTHE